MTADRIAVIAIVVLIMIVVLCFLWPSLRPYRTICIVVDADNMTAFTNVMAIIHGALGMEYMENDQVVNMKVKVPAGDFKTIMSKLENTPCVDAVEVKM